MSTKTETKKVAAGSYKLIPLADIVISKSNPRKEFDEESIAELAQSIKEKGVLQPIVVRQQNGHFELVCGERRFRGSKKAGLKDIPATVHQLTDEEALELQIIENLQRKDVHPMEEASVFKQLIAVKKFSTEEISKRVGKSTRYVAERLKLNDLVPEFQKAFYQNRLTLTDAVKLFKISTADQKELYKNKGDGHINISDWDVRRYIGSLNDAPFDIKDATLKKDMGACTSCQFNSATNTLLFPDAANNAQCMNSQCFKQKANLSYDRELKKAMEDPDTVLVSQDYSLGKDANKLVSDGHKILKQYTDYTEIDKPDYPDRADFEDDLENENFESKDEMEREFAAAVKDYEKDMEAYEKKVKSGKYLKAYVVEGNGKGKTIYIELKKKAVTSNTNEKVKEGTAGTEDIKEAIKRIKDNAVRKEKIESEKMSVELYESFRKEKKFVESKEALSKEEFVGAIMSACQLIGYHRSELSKAMGGSPGGYPWTQLYKKLMSKTPKELQSIWNAVARAMMVLELNPGQGSAPSANGLVAILFDLVNQYNPELLKKRDQERKEILDKYNERVEQKIAGLKEQLKESKKK